jgi:PleD family two-component response regulator
MDEIRILLIDRDAENARFIEGALDEIPEAASCGSWIPFRATTVERLEDAADLLAAERFDIALLAPNPEDGSAFAAFSCLIARAPEIPVVVLAERDDEALARRMVREGAQDYLIKSEIDCLPLARSIRNSIDRHRLAVAARQGSVIDELTGLYNERGFRLLAARELRLAARFGATATLLLAEIEDLEDIAAECGEQQRSIVIMEAADILRESAGEEDLIGCLDNRRFGLLTAESERERTIARIQEATAAENRIFAFLFGWAEGSSGSIDEIVAAAETALCENRLAYPLAD